MDSHFSSQVIPAWYELSLEDDSTICISVHRKALENIQNRGWDGAPAVAAMQKQFGFDTFTKPREGDCGFQNMFKLGKSDRPDWIVWQVQLPVIKTEEHNNPWDQALAIRATLWLFLSNALWLFEGNTGWPKPQLIVVEDICLPSEGNRMGSGALSATLMPPVMPWLTEHKDHTQIEAVVEAMKKADNHMWPSDKRYGRFEALFHKPKWLNLDVPGDACELAGGYNDESLKHGYTLHPHNVDSSIQQLTFLAGLARLHDLVRAG